MDFIFHFIFLGVFSLHLLLACFWGRRLGTLQIWSLNGLSPSMWRASILYFQDMKFSWIQISLYSSISGSPFFLIFFWGFLFFSLRGRPLFLDLFLSFNAGRPLFICFLCGTPRFSGGTGTWLTCLWAEVRLFWFSERSSVVCYIRTFCVIGISADTCGCKNQW